MDMDLDKIQRLLEIVAESGLDEVKVEEGDFKLTVRATARPTAAPAAPMMMAAPAAAPAPAAPAAAPASAPPSAAPAAEPGSGANESVVLAPIVGTFYEAPSPDAAAFVSVGQRVEVGQTLCIIEAMKLMNDIKSEHAGEVVEIFVENGQPVQYAERLFAIRRT